jgi:hypothetical protein
MNKLRWPCIGKALLCLVSIFLATSLLPTNAAQAIVYDDFSGTVIDPAKWNIFTIFGPSGQLWQNNGLYYSGSTGNDAACVEVSRPASINYSKIDGCALISI